MGRQKSAEKDCNAGSAWRTRLGLAMVVGNDVAFRKKVKSISTVVTPYNRKSVRASCLGAQGDVFPEKGTQAQRRESVSSRSPVTLETVAFESDWPTYLSNTL